MAALGLFGMTQTSGRAMRASSYDPDERIQLSLSDPMAYCSESSSALMEYGSAFEWVLVLGILFVTWTFASDLHPEAMDSPTD